MILSSRTRNKRLSVLTRAAAATAMASTLLLGGLAPAHAEESGSTSDPSNSVTASSVLDYSAKKTWGVNWDGFQVVIHNDTGSELTFKDGINLWAKSVTIAPGQTGTVIGHQTWWLGYYPNSLHVEYQSSEHDDFNYLLNLSGNSILRVQCGIENKTHTKLPTGCEVTRAVQTEEIKIRFTKVKNSPWLS
jgi:hypothetical protein